MISRNSVTCDVTLVHFLLMFGYKLFSAYFPLFLASRGFSLPQVGWSYLLIYLPIAICAPIAGYFSRKVNPVLLMMLGIFGYASYALAMVFVISPLFFYSMQVILGISASLFFTSSRILLMKHPMANAEHSFSWFYNAPIWGDALAPAVGGFLIWKSGFSAVFAVSVSVVLLALVVAGHKLWRVSGPSHSLTAKQYSSNWISVLKKANHPHLAPYIATSFAVLWMSGLYTFFILFLKDSLSWSQDLIISYTAYSSLFFSIAYIIFIRPRQKNTLGKNVIIGIIGAATASLSSMFFGLPLSLLSLPSIFALDFAKNAGTFICNSGRSALLTRQLKKTPEEAGALDTIFSPLGIALGSITGGFLIGPLGYQNLFLFGGLVVTLTLAAANLFAKIAKKNEIG